MAIFYVPIKQEFTFGVVEKQKNLLMQTTSKARTVLFVFLVPYITLYLFQELLLMFIKFKLIGDRTIEDSSSQLINRRMTPIARGLSMLLLPITWVLRLMWYIVGVAILNLLMLVIHVTIWLFALINLALGLPFHLAQLL